MISRSPSNVLPEAAPPGRGAPPSCEELGRFFERSGELFGVLDFEGYLLSRNQRWLETLGYAPGELEATPIFDLVHPDDRASTLTETARLVDGGAVIAFENRLRCRDGRYQRLRWTAGADLRTLRITVTARVVADTAHPLEAVRLAMEAAPQAMIAVDASGRIVLVNSAVERLFGFAREDLVGQAVERLVPERLRADPASLAAAFTDRPADGAAEAAREVAGRHRDGTEIPLAIGLKRLVTPVGSYVVGSVTDLTERLQSEAILRARIAESERHHREMRLLSEMSSLLQHTMNEGEANDIVATFGPALFPGSAGGVYAFAPSRDAVELSASWADFGASRSILPSDCWALRRAQVHASHPDRAPRCQHALSRPDYAHLCIPMSAHGQSLGMIVLETPVSEGRMADRERGSLGRAVADQLALALGNLQLREKLRDLSIRDPLTGLFNRRYLEATVAREIPRALRARREVSFLMIDVDHFKAFNDSYGHQMADDILRTLGKSLLASTRKEDIVCRYGGEEFVVVLPEAGLGHAVTKAEHLRAVAHEESGGKLTLSIGVATYPRHGESADSVLGAADRALYRAKLDGRNRVSAATAVAA